MSNHSKIHYILSLMGATKVGIDNIILHIINIITNCLDIDNPYKGPETRGTGV